MSAEFLFDEISDRIGLKYVSGKSDNFRTTRFYKNSSIGMKVTVEFQDRFVYVLITRPDQLEMPDELPDADGSEKVIHVQEAVSRLGIDVTSFRRELQQTAKEADWEMELSRKLVKFIESHWGELQNSVGVKLFRTPDEPQKSTH